VAKNYRAGADKARREVMRDLKKDLPAENYAELKGVIDVATLNRTLFYKIYEKT
jgi:hypothetical protein